ncbi:MAG: alpha/beta fold hydrolase, partial [Polyangiaceae bacterium]|nr:alpha/beta fold hydrolase [Polyangiaceae bacterium]
TVSAPNDAAAQHKGAHPFSIASKPAKDKGAPWTTHASGFLATLSNEIESASFDSADALNRIAASRDRQQTSREFYDNLEGSETSYGPAFQCVDSLTANAEEYFATLRATSLSPIVNFVAHPSLIEVAFQMSMLRATHDIVVPSYVGGVRITQVLAQPTHIHVRTRIVAGDHVFDARILDSYGVILIEILDFRLRSVGTPEELDVRLLRVLLQELRNITGNDVLPDSRVSSLRLDSLLIASVVKRLNARGFPTSTRSFLSVETVRELLPTTQRLIKSPQRIRYFPYRRESTLGRPVLVCIPYSGASARIFSPVQDFIDDMDVCAYEPPGRGTRSSEPLVDETEIIISDLLAALSSLPADVPTFFYGHSMGGILALATARRVPEGRLRGIFVGACHKVPPIELSATLLEQMMISLGTPKTLVEDPYFFNIFSSDTHLAQDLSNKVGALSLPLRVFDGSDDPLGRDESLAQLSADLERFSIRTGHFFIENSNFLVTLVSELTKLLQ